MSKKGYSRKGFFGEIHHYDSNGHKTGTSKPSILGGYTNYDAKGHKTGHSNPSFFGGYNHYDNHGHKTGHSDPSFFGSYNHYDNHGHKTSHSDPSFLNGYNHYNVNNKSTSSSNPTTSGCSGSSHSQGGCYVATAVYGSYDCPEVWTLRRFRDNTLAATWYGRAFIRTYYAISPTLVKRFGYTKWFKKMWKDRLDKMVNNLQISGFDSTPYKDKDLSELL